MNYTEDQITKAIAPYMTLTYDSDYGSMLISPKNQSGEPMYFNGKLLLKPLSAITEEDACEVARLAAEELEHSDVKIVSREDRFMLLLVVAASEKVVIDFQQNEVTIEGGYSSYNQSQIIDFIRSKGYDLPSYHLRGKTLIEAGLAIDSTVNEKEETK